MVVQSRFSMVPQWIVSHSALTHTDVHVFAVLADYFGDIYPKVSTVAQRAGCSSSTIHRSLRRLEAAGAICRQSRFDGRRQTTNLYLLAGENPFPQVARGVTGDRGEGVTRDTGEGVTGDTQKQMKKEADEEGRTTRPTSFASLAPSAQVFDPPSSSIQEGLDRVFASRDARRRERQAPWRDAIDVASTLS